MICFKERDAGCKAYDSGADYEDVAVDWGFVCGGGHMGSLWGQGDWLLLGAAWA